jgi:ADP-ribose pyrophosphatase YjhB (NUDIX family)
LPTFGVNVVIVQDTKVLLIKRADAPVWGLPGGAIDEGETVAQAALRETREETGLEVRLEQLVGIYSRPHWRFGGDIGILFRASPLGGTLVTKTDETVDAQYFEQTSLPKTLLWHHYQRILDALDNRSGVVWFQDMIWPFGAETNIQQLIAHGAVTPTMLDEQLCGYGRPTHEHTEL